MVFAINTVASMPNGGGVGVAVGSTPSQWKDQRFIGDHVTQDLQVTIKQTLPAACLLRVGSGCQLSEEGPKIYK